MTTQPATERGAGGDFERIRNTHAYNRWEDVFDDKRALQSYIDELERTVYECVSLADIMRNGLSEETYRRIVAKYEPKDVQP